MNLNNMIFRVLITTFFLSLLCSCKTQKPTTEEPIYPREVLGSIVPEKKVAKNVIFLIGDGMGMGQISAGTYANGNKSNLEKLPVVGLHKPHASSHLITDSAAAATSFACGVKTFNRAIGVDKDSIPVETILEEAESKNYKTGLVATSTIVHATPASFIAHSPNRKAYEDIATYFLKTDIDYFAGGGKKYFDRREDERNLIEELKDKGYVIEDHLSELSEVMMKLESANKFGYFSSNEDPLPVYQGRDYLEKASLAGINFLSRKAKSNGEAGFFIMIESSQIDWGGHANNSDWIIEEFKEFNSVIGKVLAWAEEDGETLVVITADHETGGYTIHHDSTQDNLITNFTSTKHTGDFIPVFAAGPGSEKFAGIYENTAIYYKMREAMGWADKK